jgi:hypothetical protein
MQTPLAQHVKHQNKYRKGTPLLKLNVSQHIFRGYVSERAFRRAKKVKFAGEKGFLQGDRKGRPYHTTASQARSTRYAAEEKFYLWQWYY